MAMDGLKQARLSIPLTQKQLADAMGVKHNTISDWETGRTSPDTEQIVALCSLLKVSADDLLRTKHDVPSLTMYEQRHIKKYRQCDAHGRGTVDMVLEREWQRSTGQVDTRDTLRVVARDQGTIELPAEAADALKKAALKKKQEKDNTGKD